MELKLFKIEFHKGVIKREVRRWQYYNCSQTVGPSDFDWYPIIQWPWTHVDSALVTIQMNYRE